MIGAKELISPTDKGKANASIITLLSDYYKVPKREITILRGKISARKIVDIQI